VILKPGKLPEARRTSSRWRLISLLNTISKIFKTIVGERFINVIKEAKILPKGQIRNRKGRFIKLVIRLITKVIYIV
jgi:hypothetical protein